MNSRSAPALAGLLLGVIAAAPAAAKPLSDLVSTDRRRMIVEQAQRLMRPADPAPLPAELAPSAPEPGAAVGGGATTEPGDGPVDLNSADLAQLDELPGVGPSTAEAIISHREKEGPFASVDALLDVRGIGPAKFEALRDLVTV